MSPPDKPADTADVDLSGRTLGDYRLLRRLGAGAMADVYLAEQTSLERNVAFKVLKAELARDETYVRRFEMEARAAASLVHANIVQIYEVGQVDGIRFIAQEYVAGQNLAQLLARAGALDIPKAVGIMRQVAAALAKAADQGIVHRDIKPENLMLSSSGEVKVADFGLARLIQRGDQLQLTQVGVTMGSPLYMSPEQVEGKTLDPRSDIYSFGVTCYQMLAGRPPFQGDSALGVAVQHLKTQPERLENVRPDLPAGLCRIVHRMLSKDPMDRYANGTEVLRELRSLEIAGLDGDWPEELDQFNTTEQIALTSARSAATQQLAAVMAEDRPKRPLRRQKWFWLAVACSIALGVILAWPRGGHSLLNDALEVAPDVQRTGTAREQYDYAMWLGTEEAWHSVLQFFPDDAYHGRLAKKQLAELYLTQNRLYEALELFDEFARAGDADAEFRAYGLAGQYVVYMLDDRPEQARPCFMELWPLREGLARFDRQMLVRAAELARTTQQLQDRDKNRELDALLERYIERQQDDEFSG